MASDQDAAYASAVLLLDLYRKRALSPVEVTRLILDRLEALEPKINAFCVVDRDGALAAARESERRWGRGEPAGRLDGVPVTIKDLVLMRGFPTLRGSRLVDPNQDWSENAPATARLREAGAVILGKTTTPEFGWKALGDSPLTGITRNPWDLSRTPGGSSAGAAAACAAGIGPLHLGSDGAGSIRIPAAFAGIFGLKPSFGRVPAYPPSPMGLLSHVGPMARTVADAALMLTVLAAPDHRDPYALPPEKKNHLDGIEGGVRGWRIAYSPTLGYVRVEPEIAAAVAAAVTRFEELGAVVEQVDTVFPSPRDALFTLWAAGAAMLLTSFPADRRELVDPGTRRDRRGRRAAQRRRLPRGRSCPQHAQPANGGVPPEVRSASDADDAGSGSAGRAGFERSRDRAALDRLVTLQLPVQHDPPACGEHSMWADEQRAADRPTNRRSVLCR
jgi:aspartyl-tRNA(Asn)/glutamyl-tRNA(Gln) amidotransferase subunit A